MTQQTSVAVGDFDSSANSDSIALLYYSVLIVTNMTGNSNCFDHFDVPCIPTRHLVSWRFHLCEIKLHCLLFVTITVLL